MKKTICAIILASFAYIPYASAEAGLRIGLSAQAGLFSASGKETSTETAGLNAHRDNDTEVAGVAYSSVFVEGTFNDKVMVGIDYVPESLSSDTVESVKQDKTSAATYSVKTNTLQVDFNELTTFYAGFHITDSSYIKAGIVTVDVVTNENLGTGGSYGDTSLDGTVVGFGFHNQYDRLFWRLEANYMDFDGATVNSSNSDNKVSINQLDGLTAKISIGTSF